jgi:hypothetical protein
MSDVAIAALAAVGGTIFGGLFTLLASILTSRYSQRTTQAQLEARKEEQLASFAHETQQHQIERLIQIRSTYLVSLAEKLTLCAQHLSLIRESLSDFQIYYGDTGDPSSPKYPLAAPIYSDLTAKLDSRIQALRYSLDSIDVLHSRITDANLMQILSDSTISMRDLIIKCNDLYLFPTRSVASIPLDKQPVSIQPVIDYLLKTHISLTNVQKQIELLLSGQ